MGLNLAFGVGWGRGADNVQLVNYKCGLISFGVLQVEVCLEWT